MTTHTEAIVRQPVESRAAWMGAGLERTDDGLIPLTQEHQNGFRGFIANANALGLGLGEIGRDTFPLQTLAPVVETREGTQSASRDLVDHAQEFRDPDGFLDHRVANRRQEVRRAR